MREWIEHAVGLLLTQIEKHGLETVAKNLTVAEYVALRSVVNCANEQPVFAPLQGE